MSFYAWRPYVPVAERRQKAQRELAKLKGATAPVTIAGRTIATSFWGKSWCANLDRYSDFDNRLPRGRTYVRNGSVVDLQITKGRISAMVVGSSLYKIRISIAPVKSTRWKAICRDCAGTVDSLVELLQGRLAKSVMDRVCREGDGLFPSADELELSCSCPDWADMCKHVAAALYGVGARLDKEPQLLFVLRGVNESELLAAAGGDLPLRRSAAGSAKVLDDRNVAALFGLDMADTGEPEAPAPGMTSGRQSPKKSTRNPTNKNSAKHSKGSRTAGLPQRSQSGKGLTRASRGAMTKSPTQQAPAASARNSRGPRRPSK